MQIYEKSVLPLKSETMTDSGNDKTYAIFDAPLNRKIVGDLEKSGANIFLFPLIKTEKIELNEKEAAHLTSLENFDWLIFADVFAVDYFLETLAETTIDAFELDDLRVCAVGEAVADRLRFASVHSDVIPAKVETPEVFSALINYIGETGGLRFLYLASDSDENDLAKNLRAKNAEVVELPIYRAIPNKSSQLIKLKTLLKGGAIDEFILTAPDDLIALKNYLGPENLAGVLAEIVVSAADGVMFQAAKEHYLPRVGLFQTSKVVKVIE
ncbi:MAG: uroporphyrinogen-III synthase [Pyrinomonadaceae bacterium]|nr:uroporphyrinogen-III synthase [Pyrinomonadaceae bacterium]